MGVHRKGGSYTIIGNDVWTDARLSAKAKGILGTMMSKPEGWVFNARGLATSCRDSVDSIRSGLKELEAFGYLERKQVIGDDRKFSKMVYEIYDYPCREIPCTENPCTENPYTEIPCTENPQLVITNQVSTNQVSTNQVSTNQVNSNSCNCIFPQAGKNADTSQIPILGNSDSLEEWEDDHKVMLEFYQENCTNLQPCISITPKLSMFMDEFLERHDLEEWKQLCMAANETDFLCGRNSSNFHAGIFFLLDPIYFRRIMDRYYERKQARLASGYDPEQQEAVRRMMSTEPEPF